MTFWQFVSDNLTKLLGSLTAMLGTVAVLIPLGAFDGLLSPEAIRWLAIFVALATGGTGVSTIARGFNNSAQVRVAEVIDRALKTPPPPETPPNA